MIKTAIENKQNLIVEGCYIPFDWDKDFPAPYLEQIRYVCLILSAQYIQTHFEDIRHYANVIEHRLDDADCTMERMLAEHGRTLELAQAHGSPYVLIDDSYEIDPNLF